MCIIKKQKSGRTILVLFFLLFFITGCDLTFLRPRQGSLTLNLEAEFEAAHFGPVLSIDSYVCRGEGPGGATFQRSWNTAGAHTVDALRTGTWNIVVEGLDAELRVVARASLSLDILPNQTNTVQLTLTPLTEGSGTLALQVDWSALSVQPTAPSLLVLATNLDQDQYAIPMTVLGAGAVGSVALPPGYYLLALQLSDGDTVRYVWNPQTFRIAAGFTTDIELACDGDGSGGGGGGGGGGGEPGGSTIWDVGAQKVLHVDFGDASTREIVLRNVTAGTLYLGKANNAQTTASATDTGKVNGAFPADGAARNGMLPTEVLVPDHPGALEFAPPPGVSPRRLDTQLDVIHFGEDTPGYVVGTTTRQFWVENANGAWIQITARLRAASGTCYLWIPDSNFSEASTALNDNLLTSTQLAELNQKFHGSGPFTGNGIRALVSNVFSTEWGGEPDGNGGIDGDQHIHILLYDIDYDYSASQTGGVLGYFWAKDEYPDSVMQQYGMRSNEAEIFYLDVHFADRFFFYIVSTLAHEYQHMIHYNQKSIKRGVSSPTWFNEMCSMVAEDLVGSIVGIPEANSPRNRLTTFNSFYFESGVTDWLSGSNVLKSYASAYAFGAYLARNFGGARLFNDLVNSTETGTAAVSASLQRTGTAMTFSNAFLEYTTALVFGNPAPAGARSFPACTTVWNGQTYTLPGFSLREYGSGPVTFAPGSQLALRPYGHSLHTASSWVNPSENTVITVEKPTDEDVEFYLMFVQ